MPFETFILVAFVYGSLSGIKTSQVVSRAFPHLQMATYRQFVASTHNMDSGEELTHSHTMTPFDTPGKRAFWKHRRKRRNCSWRAISPFPTVFSTCLDNFMPFSSILKISSANSLNLDQSKILSSGNGLRMQKKEYPWA